MSWTWFVYTQLPAKGLLEIEEELERALTEWVEERGDEASEELLETCGQVGPGGPVPPVDDVVATNARFGRRVDPEVLERLATCRSSLAIDRIRGSGLEHPLQVSVLKFILDRTGDSLVDWGDHQIALAERALEDLGKYRARRFGETPTALRKATRTRKERPGELRSVRIWNAIQHCADDPDSSIDLSRARSAMTKIQSAYLELLAANGAMDDRQAASALGVSPSELDGELDALERVIRDLAN